MSRRRKRSERSQKLDFSKLYSDDDDRFDIPEANNLKTSNENKRRKRRERRRSQAKRDSISRMRQIASGRKVKTSRRRDRVYVDDLSDREDQLNRKVGQYYKNLRRNTYNNRTKKVEAYCDDPSPLLANNMLNTREKILVLEYLKTLDKVHAYYTAGYTSPNNISVKFAQERIKNAIETELDNFFSRSREFVYRAFLELMRIATFDPSRLYDKNGNIKDIRELDEDTLACIQSFKTKSTKNGRIIVDLKTFDKMKALQEIGKYMGINQQEQQEQLGIEERARELKDELDRMYNSIPITEIEYKEID